MFFIDKRLLNFVTIITLSLLTFLWTFSVFHLAIRWDVIATVILVRLLASYLLFKDYSLSWSKASPKSFIHKSIVYIAAFMVYVPIFYNKVFIYFLVSELFFYLFSINFLMYSYYLYINRSKVAKTKSVVIYGAGKAGLKLKDELEHRGYVVKYFVDDNRLLQKRSIDGVDIISKKALQEYLVGHEIDLFIIAIPSAKSSAIREIYELFKTSFKEIQILPPLNVVLQDKPMVSQLKEISVEELLARHPQDLDRALIKSFIRDKKVLITGAGGSIGSEIARQCAAFGAKELILLDHSEYNLYTIAEELAVYQLKLIMHSVTNKELLQETFSKAQPEIVIHAAAYKHVPLVEENIEAAIVNNVIGTKNLIDCAIEHGVQKCVLISTDKAVRPTNVMGATKRVCELYAQNVLSRNTEIVGVRFGNVLGSSGSVIPKFMAQIKMGGPITVTHPEITRYFMLIPEACELVLQAASLGGNGEIFILDMGEPIKIVDLAKKMIELSGKEGIKIEFTGLRPGEKLYEELLINESDKQTCYDSITVAKATSYNIDKLNRDIQELLIAEDKVAKLKEMVPEFEHRLNEK